MPGRGSSLAGIRQGLVVFSARRVPSAGRQRSGLRDDAVRCHPIDGLRQNLRELLSQFGHGQARFCSQLLDELRPQRLVDLIRGNGLIGAPADHDLTVGPKPWLSNCCTTPCTPPCFCNTSVTRAPTTPPISPSSSPIAASRLRMSLDYPVCVQLNRAVASATPGGISIPLGPRL